MSKKLGQIFINEYKVVIEYNLDKEILWHETMHLLAYLTTNNMYRIDFQNLIEHLQKDTIKENL